MEVAGLVLGGISVVSLFQQATKCMNMIQLARARSVEAKILHQQLDNQKALFFVWGESINLHRASRGTALDDRPLIHENVVKTMLLIVSLFEDASELQSRYGLVQRPTALLTNRGLNEDTRPLRHLLNRFRHRAGSQAEPDQAGGNAMHWVISDREKYLRLVQQLRDLIEDLRNLTRSADTDARRMHIIDAEVEMVAEDELQIIEEAGSDAADELSDTASRRLEYLDARSTRTGADTVSLQQSFYTIQEDAAWTHLNTRTSRYLRGQRTSHAIVSAAEDQPSSSMPSSLLTHRIRSNIPQQQPGKATHSMTAESWNRTESESAELSRVDPMLSEADDSVKHADGGRQFSEYNALATWEKLNAGAYGTERATPSQESTGVKQGSSAAKFVPLILKAQARDIVMKDTACMLGPIEGSFRHLLGVIPGPTDTPYEGGVFFVRMEIGDDFPFLPPKCCFMTRIYHPNIDAKGAIDLDILGHQWTPAFKNVVLTCIQNLLAEPNPHDPAVPEIGTTFLGDRTVYNENAKAYTRRYALLSWPTQEMLDRPMSVYEREIDKCLFCNMGTKSRALCQHHDPFCQPPAALSPQLPVQP